MSAGPAYYTLVASLPALAPPFAEERPPLSRFALDRRLRMLSTEDRAELEALEGVMFFDRLSWELSSEAVVDHTDRALQSIRSPVLLEVATWRLGVRTAVAALRRRDAGLDVPSGRWGMGPWVSSIRRNWGRADLGLGRILPWLSELQDLLRQRRTKEFERLVVRRVWGELSRRAFLHHFDFEAVALYVLRWDLVHRATLEDGADAERRFHELLNESWGGVTLDL